MNLSYYIVQDHVHSITYLTQPFDNVLASRIVENMLFIKIMVSFDDGIRINK